MANTTTTEQTREYRSGKTSVYLTRFGQMGVRTYSEIMTRKQTADALTAKFAAATPATEADALALRFALLGVEMARKAVGSASTIERDTAALYTALAALEAETVNRPAPVAAPKSVATCRHGVAYSARCADCGEDD